MDHEYTNYLTDDQLEDVSGGAAQVVDKQLTALRTPAPAASPESCAAWVAGGVQPQVGLKNPSPGPEQARAATIADVTGLPE